MRPTEKQIYRVQKIINVVGRNEVSEYITRFYPDADLSNLTKKQAQKIITGLGSHISKPIYGVVGRDIPFSSGDFYDDY